MRKWLKDNWLAFSVFLALVASSGLSFWGLRNVNARIDALLGGDALPSSSDDPRPLAREEHVQEGNKKIAEKAYALGLKTTGLRVLTREAVLKLADDAIRALPQ